MSEFENSIGYIHNFIKALMPTATIHLNRIHNIEFYFIVDVENSKIKIYFGRGLLDDFGVALKQYRDTNYFHTIENRIKFRIYILLGEKGFLTNLNISTVLLDEKGEWLKQYKADVAFDKKFCKILYEGLKLLSISLDAILSTGLALDEIRKDKEAIDGLINYYEKNKHLTASEASMQSLAILKAAAVCVILEREKTKAETAIPSLKKGYDKEIYSIVREIRQEPFRDIKLPERVYEYAIQQKETEQEKASVRKIQTIIKEEDKKLDQLLEKLDPRLKKRREGAWLAFRSDNPDKLSQAANSMVEVLDKAISQVCKDTQLAVYLHKKYDSHEETKWVDATRKWISETKSNLQRVKHHEDYKHEILTEKLLKSAEDILLVILA